MMRLTRRATIRSIASLLAVVTLGVIGCGDNNSSSSSSSSPTTGASVKPKQIAVIAKSTVNAYWKSVEAGARQAADELKVTILWDGPDSETNHSGQAALIDNMVNRGVDGIVLAPTNYEAIVRPVDSATAKGVPVVLIDSSLHSSKPVSFVATDNHAAGAQAGEALAKAIGANKKFGGKVIMLKFLEGSGSTMEREAGFTEAVKAAGLDLVAADYTKGGGSTTDAAETADALLRRYVKDGELQVDGIFASNQPTAIGMLRKIEQFTAQGTKIDCPYVGFDAHEVLLKGIRDGKIAAIVTQDPKMMGYLGVKTMVAHLNGEKVEAKIATATATVTKANIDDPKIKSITGE
ncbi:MAG: substrate-binding domain-containing protein [Tepidisphaeraceae bacterium]